MRFYCESINADSAVLERDESHHLVNVMRAKIGDCVELFDGAGTVAQGRIASTDKKCARLEIIEVAKNPPRQNSRIAILTSVAKNDRFDWIVAKCTELGVDAVVPTIFERTVKLPKGKNSLTRWQKIAITSAKQCQRPWLPQISEPVNFAAALESCRKNKIIFGSLTAGSKSLADYNFGEDNVCVFIGPEGGMTEMEEKILIEAGATPVRLTETVLRIETAALATAAFLTIRRAPKNE